MPAHIGNRIGGTSFFDRQVAFSDGSVPHDDISVVVLKVLR